MLENINTIQDALSGTGYNVYSFAVMLRLPWLQVIFYYYICVKSFHIFIMPCFASAVQHLQSAHPNAVHLR